MSCRFCGLTLPDPGRIARLAGQTALLMIGIPDYAAYLEHRGRAHADGPVLTEAEFRLERQARRFGGGADGTFRCC